jgi:hypothetical protein
MVSNTSMCVICTYFFKNNVSLRLGLVGWLNLYFIPQ